MEDFTLSKELVYHIKDSLVFFKKEFSILFISIVQESTPLFKLLDQTIAYIAIVKKRFVLIVSLSSP